MREEVGDEDNEGKKSQERKALDEMGKGKEIGAGEKLPC